MKGRWTLTVKQRFFSKVALPSTPDGCMTWKAGLDRSGYGVLFMDGRNRRAHRVAYELLVGPVPADLVLDHLCRVRNCVRPDHLRPVTPRENTFAPGSVATGKVNAERTHCPQGHPYDERNTWVQAGRRRCRTCKAETQRAYRAGIRAKKAAQS